MQDPSISVVAGVRCTGEVEIVGENSETWELGTSLFEVNKYPG